MTKWGVRLFAGFWKRLSGLADIRLFATRYLVNLVGLVEIISLPILLNPRIYSEVELFRQLLLIAPVALLGAPSGYMIHYYAGKEDCRAPMLVVSALVGALCAAVTSIVLGNIVAGVAVGLFLWVTSLERVMVVDRRLILASIYKGLISLCLLNVGLFSAMSGMEVRADIAYPACVIAGVLVWLGIAVFSTGLPSPPPWSQARRLFAGFGTLIRKGFLVNIQSYILIGYFLADRLAIYHYFPGHGPEYAISFSLAQIVLIAINTVAFSNQQKFGEIIDHLTLPEYSRAMRMLFLLFGGILLISLPFVYVLGRFLDGYGDFLFSYGINATLLGAYYVFSAFAVVGIYRGLSWWFLGLIVAAVAANLILTLGLQVLEAGYYANIVKSGLVLVASGLGFDRLIRRSLVHGGQ